MLNLKPLGHKGAFEDVGGYYAKVVLKFGN
jgi:hypothetical protein